MFFADWYVERLSNVAHTPVARLATNRENARMLINTVNKSVEKQRRLVDILVNSHAMRHLLARKRNHVRSRS